MQADELIDDNVTVPGQTLCLFVLQFIHIFANAPIHTLIIQLTHYLSQLTCHCVCESGSCKEIFTLPCKIIIGNRDLQIPHNRRNLSLEVTSSSQYTRMLDKIKGFIEFFSI